MKPNMMIRSLKCMTAIVALMLTASCCEEPEPELNPATAQEREDLQKSFDYGIFRGEEALLEFDTSSHQLYCATTEMYARFLSNDGSEYVEFAFSDTPAVGEHMNATITVKGLTDKLQTADIRLYTLKKQGGQCWLWCDAESFGAVVMWIE